MKKLIFALLLTAAVSGCKKTSTKPNPEPNPGTEIKSRLLTSRTLNPNGHYILQTNTYNDNGSLKKEVSKDETTGLNIIQEYFYANGILEYSIISSDTRRISRINYFYANGRLIKLDYLEYGQAEALTLTFYRTLEYTGNLLSKMTTYSEQNNPSYYEVFTFLGDNLTEVKTYSMNGAVQNMVEYLYDTELNPYFGNPDRSQQALGLSKNNAMRVRYTDYINPGASSDRRYEYEYNSERYPVKKSFIGQTSRELQITFTYQTGK